MDFELNASQDDFSLSAGVDIVRQKFNVPVHRRFYLTDPSGNRLTDPSGNLLTGVHVTNFAFAMLMNSRHDDLLLGATQFTLELHAQQDDSSTAG